MNKRRFSSRSGFTLLEIMLVVVIIGLLVGVAAVNLIPQSQKAKLVAAKNQIHSYTTALGVYEMDNGFFPSTEQGLQALITQPTSAPAPMHWKQPYLQPPVVAPDPWGRPYIYKMPGQKIPGSYDLFSAGPDGVEGNEDDIGNWM